MNPGQYMDLVEAIWKLEDAAMAAGIHEAISTGLRGEKREQLAVARRNVYDLLDAITFEEGA